ncbi:MAG TPA: DUF6789 family protein [Candidatus Udaeobacter sp.]|nr:DUF6789 family protein [Candidatus Udaeobacter sp.]
MQNFNPCRAIIAGFLATIIMTVMAYIAPFFGLPKMDFAAMLGSLFAQETPQPWTAPWWAGMAIYFIDGSIIFPLIYAYLLFRLLFGPAWLRGVQWGMILWLLSQAIAMPAMGVGFFSAAMPDPSLWVIGNLIGHFVYGVILGAVAGEQAVPLPGTEREMVESRERRHGMPDFR